MSNKQRIIRATYLVEAENLDQAASEISLGQSIGHPTIRTPFDNGLKHLIPNFRVTKGVIEMDYPAEIFLSEDSRHIHVNHLMSVLMGGQMDIDHIESCRLIGLDISDIEHAFPGPRYGVEGIRKALGVPKRPLIGSVMKPKIGLDPQKYADQVKKLADAGVDFIKEDEILFNQDFCPFNDRVMRVKQALSGYKVIYAPCITSDNPIFWALMAEHTHGVDCLHLNIWSGLGAYHALRQKLEQTAIFFQKSGDKIWTEGDYSVSFDVLCKLINKIGCDFAHVGMKYGYMDEGKSIIEARIKALGNTMPSFSCGATPEVVPQLAEDFGTDIMVTSGGYIHGHKKGIEEAVREFRKAAESV